MNVFIVESSYPRDFYHESLDGLSVKSLLNTIWVDCELRMVLNGAYFRRAIREAAEKEYTVLHLSCHGDENGIAFTDNSQPTWDEFAQMFQVLPSVPPVLVMSSCCGADGDIGRAFKRRTKRPKIIFGSTKALTYSEYCTAWAILYHRFKCDGANRKTAMTAMRQISAVVNDSFVYRRWDSQSGFYRHFPPRDARYIIKET